MHGHRKSILAGASSMAPLKHLSCCNISDQSVPLSSLPCLAASLAWPHPDMWLSTSGMLTAGRFAHVARVQCHVCRSVTWRQWLRHITVSSHPSTRPHISLQYNHGYQSTAISAGDKGDTACTSDAKRPGCPTSRHLAGRHSPRTSSITDHHSRRPSAFYLLLKSEMGFTCTVHALPGGLGIGNRIRNIDDTSPFVSVHLSPSRIACFQVVTRHSGVRASTTIQRPVSFFAFMSGVRFGRLSPGKHACMVADLFQPGIGRHDQRQIGMYGGRYLFTSSRPGITILGQVVALSL
nr:hypothetical protein CFP56_64121 [Quercus suber]